MEASTPLHTTQEQVRFNMGWAEYILPRIPFLRCSPHSSLIQNHRLPNLSQPQSDLLTHLNNRLL